VRFLEKNGISFEASCAYQDNYEKELAEHSKQQKVKDRELFLTLKTQHPQLFSAYPRFGNSLINTFSEGDIISSGLTETDIKNSPLELPSDIIAFFNVVSIIALDGISIDFSALRMETLCGKDYLVLGEFWKEADGDLLLITPHETISPTPIYYYAHEINKVKKLCSSVDDLMEKKLSHFNNS